MTGRGCVDGEIHFGWGSEKNLAKKGYEVLKLIYLHNHRTENSFGAQDLTIRGISTRLLKDLVQLDQPVQSSVGFQPPW
jgi:hypothetical protein